MKKAGIQGFNPYRKHKSSSGNTSIVTNNHLNREFTCNTPNQVWVTDITYTRTLKGFVYLAFVVDLFSRKVVVWAIKDNMQTELVLDDLVKAKWRRQPTNEVMIHTDQDSQFGYNLWIKFCKDNNFKRSISRRGNYWENAVIESFFWTLKKDCIYRIKKIKSLESVRSILYIYIELFYNSRKRHGHLNGLSPNKFEKKLNVS